MNFAEGGSGKTVEGFLLSNITATNQESANPITNAASMLSTNRYSTAYNNMSNIELTPLSSCCVNALEMCIGVYDISSVVGMAFTAEFYGYNGSSWELIDTLSFTAAEAESRDVITVKINNTKTYSKYRFDYKEYSGWNSSSSRGYCNMRFIGLLNIS
jgi:hypothetical protein